MQNIEHLLRQLTVEEKAALVAGMDFWKTNPVPRLDIPSIYMTDGPCGLRKQGDQADHLGLNQSEETTSFPTGASMGSSWNPENMRKMGQAVAKECRHFGVNVLLGPAINIKRNPKCGRNFEYFSEDPLLSGEFGRAFVEAVQAEGVGVSLKHFAVNNNENYRFMGDSILDERAMREIYLRAFEKVVKQSKPLTVMCAYNKINGVYCAESRELLTEILREEWGFDGAVVSDWGAVSDRVEGIRAGMDLEMPGDCVHFRQSVIDAANSGALSMGHLDDAVRNILTLVERTRGLKRAESFDKDEHHRISGEIAADGAVLMKNDGVLPLQADSSNAYAVIGDLFRKMRFQGAGSSLINPARLTTPEQAFDHRSIPYTFSRGYSESELQPDADLEQQALTSVASADTILFFGGQTDYTESEGYDRESLHLPANQLSLLNRLIKLNKKIVFVMYGGSPVELPFEPKLSAILNMYLPGQAGGEATAQLLFGEKNPSGKLAETWMNAYEDVPFGSEFVSGKNELYKESVYVGYRYFDELEGKGVRYPFGHGLSYTQFRYDDVQAEASSERIAVRARITNIGDFAGAEVVQLYVSAPHTDVFKPRKELRGFAKTYLEAGESRAIEIAFDRSELSYYHPVRREWVLENGEYELFVAASAQDIRLTETFAITDQPTVESPYDRRTHAVYFEPGRLTQASLRDFEALLGRKVEDSSAKKPKFTLDSRLDELKASMLGRLFYKAVVGVGEKQFKRSQRMPEGAERDMERKNGMFLMKMMPNNSLRSMSVSSSSRFGYHIASGLVELLNGHPIRAVRQLSRKPNALPLPRERT